LQEQLGPAAIPDSIDLLVARPRLVIAIPARHVQAPSILAGNRMPRVATGIAFAGFGQVCGKYTANDDIADLTFGMAPDNGYGAACSH